MAGFKAAAGNAAEALAHLTRALELNAQRLKTDPRARDLAREAQTDPRLAPLLQRPDFPRSLLPPTAPAG